MYEEEGGGGARERMVIKKEDSRQGESPGRLIPSHAGGVGVLLPRFGQESLRVDQHFSTLGLP